MDFGLRAAGKSVEQEETTLPCSLLTAPTVGRNRSTRAFVPALPPDDFPVFTPYPGVKTASQITQTQPGLGAATYKPPICNSRK